MKSPLSRLTVIKLPRNRRFEFPARYYDVEKEIKEKREKRIAADLGLDKNDERAAREIRLRSKLSDQRKINRVKKTNMWSNVRLIIILVILLLVCHRIFINLDDLMAAIVQ